MTIARQLNSQNRTWAMDYFSRTEMERHDSMWRRYHDEQAELGEIGQRKKQERLNRVERERKAKDAKV